MATVKIGTVIFDGAVPRNDMERAHELLDLCLQNGMPESTYNDYINDMYHWAGAMSDDKYQAFSDIVDELTDHMNDLLPANMCLEWEVGDLIVVEC